MIDTPPADLVPIPEAQKTIEVLWGQLNLTMRKFLIARGGCGTDQEAALIAGTSAPQISNWKTERPDFMAAYTILMTSPLIFARNHVKSLAPKAVGVIDDAMNEGVPWRDRLRASEMALKANGMVDRNVTVTQRTLSYEEKLVRLRLEKGLDVPEHVLREVGEIE